jgi:hypothetical protein
MKLSTKVWLSSSAQRYVKSTDMTDPENSKWFSYYEEDMSHHGHVCVGNAEISIKLLTFAEINNGAVDALKAQVQEVRAKAEKEVMQLQDKINQLLAITNEA